MSEQILALAGSLTASYAANNHLPHAELPGLFRALYGALNELAGNGAPKGNTQAPAVHPKKSITNDFIICLEDGKKLRTLKRYLNTHYSLTPEAYRQKWGLSSDYPMVAPSYTRLRSDFAKKIGLGRTGISRGRGRQRRRA